MKKIVALLLLITVLFQQTSFVFAENTDFKFEKIAESMDAILYVDKKTATLRLESKNTKDYVDTKVFGGQAGNEVSKNFQKSDLVYTYIDDRKTASLKSIDTYSMSVSLDKVTYEPINNGIKIIYDIGEDKLTLNDFPKYVEAQKMVDLVISNLTDTQRKAFDEEYSLRGDRYMRINDKGVTDLKLKRLYDFFYTIGSYTKEDLEADNTENNVILEDTLLKMKGSIKYQLEGMDLLVTVPVNEIEISEKHPITNINLLPYFMSSTQQQDGYMFIPDGSGAIINFNNRRNSDVNYSTRIYEADILKDVDKYKANKLPNTLPVFGIKWDDMAMLAIVEKGETMAEITSEISGKSDEFNRIGLNFSIREIERIAAISNVSVTQPKYSNDVFNEDIIVRYKMLEGTNANYSGMAKAYQKYLVDRDKLTKHDIKSESPMFIELMGSIDIRKFFLGIPYKSNTSLTTFKQALEIMRDIRYNGVDNLNIQYTGWMNNGTMHSAVSNLKLESVLGTKSDFTNILDFVDSNKIGFYPTVNLASAVTTKNLDKNKQIARLLDGDTAKIPQKTYAYYDAMMIAAYDEYTPNMISPHYLSNYIDKFIKKADSYHIKGIYSKDIGQTIVPDYNSKREMARHNAIGKFEESIDKLGQKYELVLSNPNAYAFKDVRYITDLPFESNNYKVSNYSVPFVQMVLDGYVEYSSTAINQMSHKSLDEVLLNCIETRSAPKFLLMNEKEDKLKNTPFTYIFSAQYNNWKDKIQEFYSRYNEFYKSVYGAEIEKHEVLPNGIRKITYTNGVKVYINYSDTPIVADSKTIRKMNYEISK